MTHETKYSKNGWPISAEEHSLGYHFMRESHVKHLVDRLNSRFSVGATVESTNQENVWTIKTKRMRLSMERYGNIQSFIEGYKAAY